MSGGGEGPVVVVGAGSGIGLASAEAILRAGGEVVGVDLAPAPSLPEAGERLTWVEGDVREAATWEAAAAAWSGAGAPRALVHCAATLVEAPFLETSLEDWRRLFAVNVLGAVRAIAAAAPAMAAVGGGAIVVVCSVDSLFADDGLAAYATSKAALLAVVRAAALEYAATGVAVNALCPSSVDTPLLRRVLAAVADPEATLAAVAARNPRGSLLRPPEVAAAAEFLCRRAGASLTGAGLVLDGGLTSTPAHAPASVTAA